MEIGLAIRALRAGEHVARPGWNGKGMWLAIREPAKDPEVRDMTVPFIYMKTADNQFVPWLASQTDILADDWVIIGAPDAP